MKTLKELNEDELDYFKEILYANIGQALKMANIKLGDDDCDIFYEILKEVSDDL